MTLPRPRGERRADRRHFGPGHRTHHGRGPGPRRRCARHADSACPGALAPEPAGWLSSPRKMKPPDARSVVVLHEDAEGAPSAARPIFRPGPSAAVAGVPSAPDAARAESAILSNQTSRAPRRCPNGARDPQPACAEWPTRGGPQRMKPGAVRRHAGGRAEPSLAGRAVAPSQGNPWMERSIMRRHSTAVIASERVTRRRRGPVVLVAPGAAVSSGLPTLRFGWAAVTLLTLAIPWLLVPVA